MTQQEPSAATAFVARCSVGDVLTGTVAWVEPFGAFVEVADGVHGLLPRTEWTDEPRLAAEVTVRILAIDPDQGRFSLAPA
jgi:ribosomal protein S1